MPRILVADDEMPTRELLRAILLGDSHEVHVAENGSDALDLLRKSRFDLAMLDVHMPIMSGLDVVRIVRSDQKLRGLPVIICTASSTPAEIDAAMQAGANAYVIKTMLHPQAVLGKIAQVLGK